MTRAWQCLPQNDAAQEAEYPGVGQGVPREGNEEGIFFFFFWPYRRGRLMKWMRGKAAFTQVSTHHKLCDLVHVT